MQSEPHPGELKMQHIPHFKSYDPKSKRLTLSGAQTFPLQIVEYANDIEILDMSHGELTTLSPHVAQLSELKIVLFSHNPLSELHGALALCPNLILLGLKSCHLATIEENTLPTSLHWLILTDNKLNILPASIGALKQLRKLSLAGNQLTHLPIEMQACQNLELIRLGANKFTTIPDWLLTLPHLAWYGGVHQRKQEERDPKILEIPYADIAFVEMIGSSPSSEVWKARWSTTGEDVAVKIYKSHLTSDGWPEDDMRMCIAAGVQPNLIPVLGKLSGHPENKHGLVLQLIPPSFHTLGLPPSLETCTRDTFAPGASWSLPFIIRVLRANASACEHLHRKGIIHGDLYAHNILVNQEGDCYLGDFGAASLYDRSTDGRFEQIEVRAFGYLIEDLLDHCPDQFSSLEQLKNSCLDLNISARPLFSDILSQLKKISRSNEGAT